MHAWRVVSDFGFLRVGKMVKKKEESRKNVKRRKDAK